MSALARWRLKVSREADIGLRTLLASRGGRKGDLSRFVEDAVNRAVLRETINQIHERNAHLDPQDVQRLVDAELAEARQTFRAGRGADAACASSSTAMF